MAQNPPGPTGPPLVGSSRRYARDPFSFLAALERAYGTIARFDLGPMPVYVLFDPDAIEYVLVEADSDFRKPDFQEGPIGDLLGDGLLLSNGVTWRRQRQLANPAFGMDRLSGMADRITAHAESRVEAWSPGAAVDVEEAMTRITLDVICDLMMGVELDEATVKRLQRQLEPLGRRFEPDPIRFALPNWVPMPGDAEFEAAVDAVEEIVDDVIARRQGDVGSPDDPDAPMDFLSILLRARQRGEQSRSQLRDELVTMLLAGHDTTALTLTYTWYLLSEHPDVERRVQAEVDAVLDGASPGFDHVQSLEYTDRVIQEALRLYPPVYAIFRTATARFEVDGYTVPAGSMVMLPQWAVHRSARLWEDPTSFDPDRWTPERNRGRHRFASFPFGGGPRHCIGKHLAMLEAKLIVATVASRYRLEYLGTSPLDLMPTLTAHPRTEMQMRVEPRE